MIKKGYNKHHSISRVVNTLLLLFICLVSCQTETEKDNLYNETSVGPFKILPVFRQAGMEISTRALIDGYSLYTPQDGELIYAWAQEHTSGTTLKEGEFRRSGGKWYSSVEAEGGKSYYMFAFHPGGISSTRGTFTKVGNSFTLNVNPIDIVTLGDPTISIAAARSVAQNGVYNDPTPVAGTFNLGQISNNIPNDKVLLAMNHLYSKVDLSFTLHEKYSKLRTVVITGIKMVSSQGSSSMSLTFGANPNPNWGDCTSKNLEVSLPLPNDSIVLNASNTVTWNGNEVESYIYQTAGSFCYLPKTDLPVELEVTYNVYTGDTGTDPLTDENYKDRLVRKDQTARNGKILPTGSGRPRAGTSYAVKINVVPSYLYQLSDDDLDTKLPIE